MWTLSQCSLVGRQAGWPCAGVPGKLHAVKAEHHQARAAARLKLANLQRRAVAELVQRGLQGRPARRAQRLFEGWRALRPRELRYSKADLARALAHVSEQGQHVGSFTASA